MTVTAPDDELFFGLPLSTHRSTAQDFGLDDEYSYFLYEALIACISIVFFRCTLHGKKEPAALRWFFAIVLGFLAGTRKSYTLISAVELFSYLVPWLLGVNLSSIKAKTPLPDNLLRLSLIAVSGCFSLMLSHYAGSGELMRHLGLITPNSVTDMFHALIPIDEVVAAYNIMAKFQKKKILDQQIEHLFFVTFHLQFGIGHLGIDFLSKEQQRRNELVRMDTNADSDFDEDGKEKATTSNNDSNITDGKKKSNFKQEKATRFQRGAAPFIIFTAVPYMIQIIFFGNINKFASTCLEHDMHRQIRLNELFDQDHHLQALAVESATSPEAYAKSMDVVVSTTYDMFNRKLFSLPKVMLLPSVISKTPQMMAQIFPFIFITDWAKGRFITYMTTRVETLQKEINELSAIRSKIESFDMKNAELLQRSGRGATKFTQKRWETLSVQIQAKSTVSDLITRTKAFFAWIQRNFVFSVLVDCALANLIVIGKIASAEIFVFSRAIEDAVDMVLMKSRSEAELARMMTEIEKLSELSTIWTKSSARSLIHCKLAQKEQDGITLRHVHYSRGTAAVHAEHVELKPGIYALTGANGSGKSTLFRLLMSCDTNDKSIDLPASIAFSTPSTILVEKDDLDDEASCEVDAQAEKEEAAVCNDESGGCATDDETSPDHVPQPKLSITMPSSHVVEISQTFYWPLYTKPIDWIFEEHISETYDKVQFDKSLRRTAEALQSMSFFQSKPAVVEDGDKNPGGRIEVSDNDGIETVIEQLQEEKEDWFNDLSGGQKSKVELVRKVFLQDRCPNVVLIDETLAPLDPTSKSLVMARLKSFCSGSIIIVIYHADIGHGKESDEGETIECVPSSNFFDHNLHLENQNIQVRPVC